MSETRPSYYGGANNPYEVIKVIKAFGWLEGFCKGNTVKYTARGGKKDKAELRDMRKARQYLDFWIQDLEEPFDDTTTAREAALEVAKSLQHHQEELASRELYGQPSLFDDEEWREDHKKHWVNMELEQSEREAKEMIAKAEKMLRPAPQQDEVHRGARSLEPRDMVKIKGI